MFDAVRRHYDEFPEPSPDAVPIGPGQLDRMDDNLHYGWSWSRYRYCYRRADALRVPDAGCGTGLTSVPRDRAAASATGGVEFRVHYLDDPLSAACWPRRAIRFAS